MRYLGIDGGGSKTAFLLVDEYYNEICHVEAGPSNWLSVGADAAKHAITQGISHLRERPNIVCAGFAGAARSDSAAFYKQVLESLIPGAQIIIESDAFIASIGAIGIDPGILLIAGTGSIVIGRDKSRNMFRVGGWGPYFGDEGSGFWVGREAVRQALRSLDVHTPTEFSNRIATQLGLRTISDVVGAWASGKIGVPDIAGLFPEVVSMYPQEPANQILNQAANTYDHEKAAPLYARAQEIISRDVPVLPLWYQANIVIAKKTVGNIHVNASGDWGFVKDLAVGK